MKQYFKIFLAMLIIEFGSALCAGAKFDHSAANICYQTLMANPAGIGYSIATGLLATCFL